MTIKFACPQCGRNLSAPESAAGQRRKCPSCRMKVEVPVGPPSRGGQTGRADRLAAATEAENADLHSDHPLLLFPARGHHGDLIDMTAMVDIVFFLLIFFLVTSMQSLEAVIDLPAPQTADSAATSVQAVPDYANDPNFVVVSIDSDDAVWVEDEEALSEQDLRAKLRAARLGSPQAARLGSPQAARQEDEREGMLVKGAGEATHGKFVMVLDAGADAGMKELLFSVEQTDEEADGG